MNSSLGSIWPKRSITPRAPKSGEQEDQIAPMLAVARVAAIVSGMSSLTRGAARQLNGGNVRQAIIEMDNGFLFLMNVSNGSVLGVVAEANCDIGLIGYEMALLVSRTEATLTPQLISEMRGSLPVDGATRAPVG